MPKDKDPSHVYPRKPVFYQNYDLYETEGVDGPPKGGPGTGFYSHMNKYKSVSDFRKKKRQEKARKKKMALLRIACDCNLLDFPSDSIQNTIPFESSNPIGMLDTMYPQLTDGEGHTVNKVYYGNSDNPDPIYFNPLGVADGNERAIDEEPDETKNNYYGILDSHNV